MCGIAGYIDFRTGAPAPSILVAMTQALARRGPDAHGTVIYGPCGLAHTRLSVIDVDGSPQPMTAPDHPVSLVYNGELYNYMALREALVEAGETLTTNGDSETVLRWVAREWDGAMNRFDGMFAFGAWDRDAERLLLARDSVGEKPLFYATPAPGLLVFASEAKAVLAHPEVDRGLNEDALRQALRFRAVYQNGSLHKGVQQLAPGAFLEFSRAGLRVERFYDLPSATRESARRQLGTSDEKLVGIGRDLFLQSVEERLVADVPVGAFLSGGLDSSMIVAAMRKIRGASAEIRTYSVGFRDDPHSELPHAQMVADAVGARHTPIVVGPEAYIQRLAELSACRDGPVSEPADVAVAEMSRVARQSVKVALSGEGADEVFAGYPKYTFANAPLAVRQGVRILGAERSAALAGLLGLDRNRAMVAARSLVQPREIDRIVQWFSHMDRKDLASLLPGLRWSDDDWAATTAVQEAALAQVGSGSALLRMQTVDCLTWLPGNMLERGDRMTMAEGLEVRPPFLDRELAAFGLALPDRLKIKGGVGKWIVRQWGATLLPREILERKKWGFRVPLDLWFRGPLKAMLHGYLTNPRGLCGTYGDRKAVAALLERHGAGEVDAAVALWTLLSTEVWYQDVFLARQSSGEAAVA